MFGLTLAMWLAIAVAAYMAWNIGANDVANAMGTSVGSGALTLRNAIIIAAGFEFCGAFFAGDAVTDTVRKGVLVIPEEEMARLSEKLQYGFIAAMLAAALWITVATRYGLPVSTTHSILGGSIGFGLFLDPALVDFQKVGQIVLSWVISPLLGGVLAYGTFTVIRMTSWSPMTLSSAPAGWHQSWLSRPSSYLDWRFSTRRSSTCYPPPGCRLKIAPQISVSRKRLRNACLCRACK